MYATVVIARSSAGTSERAAIEEELGGLCVARGLDTVLVPDLYHVADRSHIWEVLAALPGPIVVFGRLYPRPLEWLLRSHGVGEDGLRAFDLGAYEDARSALRAALPGQPQEPGIAPGRLQELQEAVAPRWYPLVDRSRCTNCRHCLQFCIFGVYELDEAGHVTTKSPDNCKPGCPACARVCPNSAIMFPLHADDEAIAGAPGKFVTMDAAARRMYYLRTGARCPKCGLDAAAPPAAGRGGEKCAECGRRLPDSHATPAEAPRSEVLDEIDALINELDNLAHGSQ